MNAGVPTETTVGRHHMDSVTGEKDAAALIVPSDVGNRTPPRHAFDLHRVIGNPNSGTQ